jgi:hypothetical protein
MKNLAINFNCCQGKFLYGYDQKIGNDVKISEESLLLAYGCESIKFFATVLVELLLLQDGKREKRY